VNHLLAVLQAAQPALPTVGQFLALGGALLTSFGLGKVKGLDTTVTNSTVFRKLQPVITLGGAFLAPLIAQKLGVTIDPSAWGAAPLATVITITGAELGSIIHRSVK
jgi:hypothetical protein